MAQNVTNVSHTEEVSSTRRVIAASSVGTLIEWYDFYIFGTLAKIISEQFFPKDNPTAALLATLATFAAGFVIRPFGALFFGRLGDLIGRKYTFLVTLVIMGGSTFAIGLVPGYKTIGFFAPAIVFILRLLQGLALGGEYGGAATYVAEHSPEGKRGFWTSFIQTTATLGLFLALGVILTVRQMLGVETFTDWGWRIPFILSALLVGVSIFIRMRMSESPLFAKMKKEGKTSANPLAESFKQKDNLKMVLIALLGATAGQGVVWYTGQFYALSFLQNACNIEFVQSNIIISIALLIGTPFFIVFGALSDKIGRKYIMMAGMLIAVIAYRPIYTIMYNDANLKTKEVIEDKTVNKMKYEVKGTDSLITSVTTKLYTDGTSYKETVKKKFPVDPAVKAAMPKDKLKPETKKEVTLPQNLYYKMIGLVLIQVIFVTMVYGPIAAFLVEIFPTRIRYTSMSLPYHIGNGVFGGLVPLISTRLVEATRPGPDLPPADPLAGLWYPILIAGVSFVIGSLYISNKTNNLDVE
ncbi:MHS family MFS transporter [Chlorobium sp. BLA1]|uniref:MFS transporter n=1 Tax=Candidatus Chlorobium masyuteum TaxID=2716876 RepID=UPI001423174D|nr:MFS transporter [Candidatus Chlorobium masyuteum]NHQ60178.1 MHS family MFS transporter [Candidatus Chlorobium masyuteum]NTU44559.1 MHS family MFS transporter [Chlorobiaceae bacterium]